MLMAVALVMTQCAGNKQWAEPPAWVSDRPNIPGYYTGIASANKIQHGEDAKNMARNRALSDISSQIRVVIESTSILNMTQYQGISGENFSENIKSVSSEDLEGYELIEEYENGTDVWVYFRLSEATYKRIRNERKKATLDIAGGYWQAANEAQANGRVAASLDFYVRALESMEKYWGELNQWTTPNQTTITLDRACLEGITQVLSSIEMTASASQVMLTYANRYSGELGCSVKFHGNPAAQVPVWSRYNKGTLPRTDLRETNADGVCSIELGQFEPGLASTEVRMEIRFEQLVPRIKESHVHELIKNLPTPSLTIPVYLRAPIVFIQGNERTKGQTNATNVLNNAIAQGLNAQGIEWVNDASAADLILELDADTREAGSAAGFYTVLLNATAVLKTSEGKPVLQQNLTDVKGVQLNWEAAHAEAYRKAQLEIQGVFLKKLIQALYR